MTWSHVRQSFYFSSFLLIFCLRLSSSLSVAVLPHMNIQTLIQLHSQKMMHQKNLPMEERKSLIGLTICNIIHPNKETRVVYEALPVFRPEPSKLHSTVPWGLKEVPLLSDSTECLHSEILTCWPGCCLDPDGAEKASTESDLSKHLLSFTSLVRIHSTWASIHNTLGISIALGEWKWKLKIRFHFFRCFKYKVII